MPSTSGSGSGSEAQSDASSATLSDASGNRDRKRRKTVKKLENKVEKLADRLESSSKSDKSFKYKSNRDQWELNASILQSLRTLKKSTRKHSRKRKITSAAIKKLEKRNKHIRIADKAKSGWRAVALYETDDVASDPEDDRRIKRCDKRALELMDEEHDRRKRVDRTNRDSQTSRFRNAPRQGRSPPTADRCFRCGRYGHWGGDCNYYRDRSSYGRTYADNRRDRW